MRINVGGIYENRLGQLVLITGKDAAHKRTDCGGHCSRLNGDSDSPEWIEHQPYSDSYGHTYTEEGWFQSQPGSDFDLINDGE